MKFTHILTAIFLLIALAEASSPCHKLLALLCGRGEDEIASRSRQQQELVESEYATSTDEAPSFPVPPPAQVMDTEPLLLELSSSYGAQQPASVPVHPPAQLSGAAVHPPAEYNYWCSQQLQQSSSFVEQPIDWGHDIPVTSVPSDAGVDFIPNGTNTPGDEDLILTFPPETWKPEGGRSATHTPEDDVNGNRSAPPSPSNTAAAGGGDLDLSAVFAALNTDDTAAAGGGDLDLSAVFAAVNTDGLRHRRHV